MIFLSDFRFIYFDYVLCKGFDLVYFVGLDGILRNHVDMLECGDI